jgi:hypothetical protein
MYSKIYVNLKKKYNHDNFEVIAKAIDTHFCDLFKLDILNDEANLKNSECEYTKLFNECMKENDLPNLFSVKEVVQNFTKTLQTQSVIEKINSEFIFVPPEGLKPSKQLGFLEKTATKELKKAEPLTFFDMVRFAYGVNKMLLKEGKPTCKIGVMHLTNLMLLNDNDKKDLKKNEVLIINLNHDLKATPKWGVVRLSPGKPVLYCETPLTETEKAEVESGLTMKFAEEQFIGGTANSLVSTGYMALSWLDNAITHSWNFDTNADFHSLIADMLLVYFGGDNPGLKYNRGECDRYADPNFVGLVEDTFSGICPGKLAQIYSIATLSQIAGEAITPGDLIKTIEILGNKKPAFDSLFAEACRSLPPGFSKTLDSYPGLLTTNAESVALNITEKFSSSLLETYHGHACKKTNTNTYWFNQIWNVQEGKRELGNVVGQYYKGFPKEEFYATTVVLALIRSRAKKPKISIDLPSKYQLNREEQTFIINTLADNAYVTEFLINENESLKEVKEELRPIFARNRWLKEQGYRPPLVDDYWKQAARYWLVHLTVSDVLEPKKEHDLFKRCVLDMGLEGLNHVFALLNNDAERAYFETLYARAGKAYPAFYAACSSKQYETYLQTLSDHLVKGGFFPFSELGISYQPKHDKPLVSLITQLNGLKKFEKLTLTECLKDPTFSAFLTTLIKAARDQQWVSLIIIPELEDKTNTEETTRALRVQYALLNDIILKNRHQKVVNEELKELETTNFEMPEPGSAKKTGSVPLKKEPYDLSSIIEKALKTLKQTEWPLKKGGATQLQLQQQQQLNQSYQVQQEEVKELKLEVDQAVGMELVDYTNIHMKLKNFWEKHIEENPPKEKAATLKTNSETLLQGFFHTWINVNPQTKAQHAIKKMTLEAAQVLLRKHRRLTSGLNPDNLPKGFYTQRSKDGDLILCYSAALAYVNPPNQFTLDLGVSIPQSEAWEGDFRQFDLDKYIKAAGSKTKFGSEDWKNILLFAAMQPPKKDYKEDYKEFVSKNPGLAAKCDLIKYKNKIRKYWPVFLQAWQYAGEEGVTQFLKKSSVELTYASDQIKAQLFSKFNPELSTWALNYPMDEAYLRALGQIYYRFGTKGMILFLRKLQKLQLTLGDDFFHHFNQHFLAKSSNFNCFMNLQFFTALDDMIEQLKPNEAQGTLIAWEKVLKLHLESVDWEPLEKLWSAFKHFTSELGQLGLSLEGTEFDGIKPENMLVFMERVLNSLRSIPDYEQQKRFLAGLSTFGFDLNYGGIHYALQHEGFRYFSDDLQLKEFVAGSPTYAPNLIQLYDWGGATATLQMKRTLASKGQFNAKTYQFLNDKLGNEDKNSKDRLMWLLHTQYNKTNIEDVKAVWAQLTALPQNFQKLIGGHLFKAVYQRGNIQLNISLETMVKLASLPQVGSLSNLFNDYPEGTVLEALSILDQAKRWDATNIDALFHLLKAPLPVSVNYPPFLFRESFKLATLFGVTDPNRLEAFYTATEGLRPIVSTELNLLINQLLSVEYTSNVNALTQPMNWDAFLECINQMKNNMANITQHRIAFIEKLNAQDVEFKYSKSGEFRAIKGVDPAEKPLEVSFFVDHESRLWNFLKDHLLVPVKDENAQAVLKPILLFLKRLQLNRTYLNEIEPLLASLEKTPKTHYWSANYFLQLLRALQPENEKFLFPISLVKVLLKEPLIAAKKLDQVEKDFPEAVSQTLKIILKNTVFDREQQEILCQIALREFAWEGKIQLLHKIINLLVHPHYAASRVYALEVLEKSKNFSELESRFENCSWLMQHAPAAQIQSQWTKVSALWLKALSGRKQEEELFHQIKNKCASDPNQDKLSLILHILAFSTLRQGLSDKEQHRHNLDKKALKLVDYLFEMNADDLVHLAQTYPSEPSPTAEDIIHLIKKQKKQEISWVESFETFRSQPFTEPRTDYGMLASTRDSDLQRMILDTKISGAQARQPLDIKTKARLTLIFSYLKQLEAGTIMLSGSKKPISKMNPEELAQAFHFLSKQPESDFVRAQIWAVLFDILGRTTHKYPHLAQQFALIANDIGLTASKQVMQLATGEGKSHFVAMCAAREVAQGNIVEIFTAKRTLAERDLEDYQSFFDYLGLKAAHTTSDSTLEQHEHVQIYYSTLGDLSLFLDQQNYLGRPINIPKEKRVALFDEFDFIRFDEGRKTQYNYARPTGKMPKQMVWFYQSVNAFYEENQKDLIKLTKINIAKLGAFAKALQKDAGDNEEHQLFVSLLMQDPVQLVQWLQSAHEAFVLQWGIDFTVREENIKVSKEPYPMREVIPLSQDNQKMIGSTFSAGVHQLLAVRLNTAARLNNEAQNFHIHPESNIISSQVAEHLMKTLWSKWKGFTGTISAAQAQMLFQEEKAQVLHVPTNQRDLRLWHSPQFYDNEAKRNSDLLKQIEICLEKKQSMLFSCKNDKKVEWLKKLLEAHFGDSVSDHFIFYTNEEHETAAEVLKRKEVKENWHGGKKQQAVGLVASGFGRGDNVGVEAVFLMDVNDTNDKLQKGGRTARNGEEGEVFQYYLSQDLEAEEKRLMKEVEVLLPGKIGRVKAELAKVKDSSQEAECFERVMLLREYVFNLQNAANQGYHNAIAQYTGWGMRILGTIEDPTLHQTLVMEASMLLKKLDKLWVDICSQEGLVAEDKIKEIEKEIADTAGLFWQECVKGGLAPEAFSLAERDEVEIQLVVPENPAQPTEAERAVASICSVISQLSDLIPEQPEVTQIPEQLTVLASDAKKLQQFAAESRTCTTVSEFVDKLNLAVLQAKNPSKDWSELKHEASKIIEPKKLFEGVSDKVRVACEKKLEAFIPELQDQMVGFLGKAHLTSATSRIEKASPLMEYLGHFSTKQQKEWGSDYLANMPTLSHLMSESLLNTCFKQSKPMSCAHFMACAKIINTVKAENKEFNSQEASELHTLLVDATQADPEQRMRMLTKWESWAKHLPEHQRKPFLTDFCQAMHHFKKGENWDVFSNLVAKTQKWITKNESAYVPDLLEMWHQLATHASELSYKSEFLNWAANLGGKSWYQAINKILPVSSKPLFQIHLEQFKKYWEFLDTDALKQQEKMTQFQEGSQGITDFYKVISGLNKAQQEVLKNKILALDSQHVQQLALFMKDLGELAQEEPKILETLFIYLNDPDISVPSLDLFRQILTKAIQYQVKHDNFNYDRLKAIAYFKNCNDATLTSVIELMGAHEERTDQLFQFLEDMGNVAADEPKIWDVFLPELKDPKITETRLDLVRQFLTRTIRYQVTHHGFDYDQLMKNLSCFKEYGENTLALLLQVMHTQEDRVQQVLTMDPERIHQLIKFIEDMGDLAPKKPEGMQTLISYFCDPGLSLGHIDLLRQILAQTIRYQVDHPHFDYKELMQGIDRFRDKNVTVLALLLETMGRVDKVEPLLDNVVFYLNKRVPAASRAQVLDEMNLFYTLAERHSGSLEQMQLDPEIQSLFNLSEDSKERQNRRLIWMHLIQRQVFVKEQVLAPHQNYLWVEVQNEALLHWGFSHYLNHTQAVLNEHPSKKPNTHQSGDLTDKQKRELLKLSDELMIIGTPQLTAPPSALEKEAKASALSLELNKRLSIYQASWFKSAERENQAKALMEDLNELVTEEPSYKEVLKTITLAKEQAIQMDAAMNKKRWFKLNRSGESRYLNTLNQMYDLVLRQWSLDVHEVHSFNEFKQDNLKEFWDLTGYFQEALTKYFDAYHVTPPSPKYNKPKYNLARLFHNTENRANVEVLKEALRTFCLKKADNLVKGLHPYNDEMVKELLQKIQENQSKLPGDLITLANEVVLRGTALGLNLEQQPDLDKVRGLFKGGS